jgi:hypothetical protein
MRRHTPIKQCALFVGLLVCALGGSLHARDISRDDLQRCAALASDADKLACYERLSSADNMPDAVPAGDGPQAGTGPESLSTVAAEPSAVDLPAATGSGDLQGATTDRDEKTHTPVETATWLQGEDSPGSSAIENLGSEQVGDENGVPDIVVVTVSSVSRGHRDVLFFHLANGQVWRQIEPRRFRYPKDGEFEATINTGMMGEYRLRVEEDGPMTRIRRVE